MPRTVEKSIRNMLVEFRKAVALLPERSRARQLEIVPQLGEVSSEIRLSLGPHPSSELRQEVVQAFEAAVKVIESLGIDDEVVRSHCDRITSRAQTISRTLSVSGSATFTEGEGGPVRIKSVFGQRVIIPAD